MNPFKFPWAVYVAVGLILSVFGVPLYFGFKADDEQRAIALRSPPPKTVAIEKFVRSVNSGPTDEVNIIAQVDLARWVEFAKTKNGDEKHHWSVIPLYPADATDNSQPAPGMIAVDRVFKVFELDRGTIAKGPLGPVVRINGKLRESPADDLDADNDAGREFRKIRLTRDPVIIAPYENGRAAEMQQMGPGFPIGVIVVGLVLFGYGFFRRYREPIEEASYY